MIACGCASSLAKPSATFSQALAPVVDQSAAAYRGAVALHDRRADYEAVVAYQNKDSRYDPRSAPELLSQKDLQARLGVLAALQTYAQSLVAVTGATDSKELDAASKSAGSNLTAVGNDLAPSIDNVLGISAAVASTTETTVTTVSGSTTTTTSSTSSTPAPLLSPTVRNAISTAIDALGQALARHAVEQELPGRIIAMDPHVQTLCKALGEDIGTIEDIEEHDYNRILNLEKQFILQDEQGRHVDPAEHRAEIMKLPEIARRQRADHDQLEALRGAIVKLADTHHALAAAAQGKSPETLHQKLDELAEAGSHLGTFYSSLPTN
jgi:hypothetical protein